MTSGLMPETADVAGKTVSAAQDWKKLRVSASTACGLRWYCSYSSSRYPSLTPRMGSVGTEDRSYNFELKTSNLELRTQNCVDIARAIVAKAAIKSDPQTSPRKRPRQRTKPSRSASPSLNLPPLSRGGD